MKIATKGNNSLLRVLAFLFDLTIIALLTWYKFNKRLKNRVKLWDIAPTILYILGVPIASYMDGKVLIDIFHRVSESSVKYIQLEKERIRKKIRELRKKL